MINTKKKIYCKRKYYRKLYKELVETMLDVIIHTYSNFFYISQNEIMVVFNKFLFNYTLYRNFFNYSFIKDYTSINWCEAEVKQRGHSPSFFLFLYSIYNLSNFVLKFEYLIILTSPN